MSLSSTLIPKLAKRNQTMNAETYLNHPNFGLLYRVCKVEESRELFATLYAQRLFFLVTTGEQGLKFDPLSRTDARFMVETRLRNLRRTGSASDYEQLQLVHRNIFQ
jgi:PII interaction protein X